MARRKHPPHNPRKQRRRSGKSHHYPTTTKDEICAACPLQCEQYRTTLETAYDPITPEHYLSKPIRNEPNLLSSNCRNFNQKAYLASLANGQPVEEQEIDYW